MGNINTFLCSHDNQQLSIYLKPRHLSTPSVTPPDMTEKTQNLPFEKNTTTNKNHRTLPNQGENESVLCRDVLLGPQNSQAIQPKILGLVGSTPQPRSPIASMYGIYTCIYHKNQPNVRLTLMLRNLIR